MKRNIWLQKILQTDELSDEKVKFVWNLLPDDPYAIEDGCALISPKGLGYQQNVTQEQVEVDYFISQISSANKSITGVLYFNGDKHLQNFQEFVGDFRNQFLLYYSPDAKFEMGDQISSIYYKPVIITQVDKTEKDQFGWYTCSVTFVPQSDVWKKDLYLSLDGSQIEDVGEALVYPYTYKYVYGGRNVFSIDAPNDGRETGCIIRITNKSGTPITNLEWFIENTVRDYYGVEHKTVQRSKWYFQRDEELDIGVTLQNGYTLYVDSNPVTQEAKVIYTDGTSQSVVNWQEPSWEYINFVRIKHGNNRFVFYMESKDVMIEVIYQEQKEII